jgi:hypothetical protein
LDIPAPKQCHIGSVANVPHLHSINGDIILRQEALVQFGAELFADAFVSFCISSPNLDLGGRISAFISLINISFSC